MSKSVKIYTADAAKNNFSELFADVYDCAVVITKRGKQRLLVLDIDAALNENYWHETRNLLLSRIARIS